jgi:hypothetical protein
MTFENLMLYLQVPNLLNNLLEEMSRARPSSAQNVMATMERFVTLHKDSYYAHVVTQFHEFVRALPMRGFQEGYSLFFAVPQNDGSTVELFPGGSMVRVTSHNIDSFLHLLHHFERSSPYRYTDHIELLPLSPRRFQSTPYNVILDLLQVEVSKWKLSEKTWTDMHIAWCVPYNGIVVDLIKEGALHPVQHDELHLYIEKARAFLNDNSRNSVVGGDWVSDVEGNEEANARREYELFVGYLKALHNANTPQGETITEEEFNDLDLHYCVPVFGRNIDLVPDGRNIRVPFHEKDRYVALVLEKLGIKFGEERPPSLAGARTPRTLSPRVTEVDLFHPAESANEANRSDQSRKSNKQSPEVISYYFRQLLQQLDGGIWNEVDLAKLAIRFEVPIDGKMYPLIPNGENIFVNTNNKDEFIIRARQAIKDGIELPNIPKKDTEDKVLEMFSPQHFETDLFSPYTPSTGLTVGASIKPQNSVMSEYESKFWDMVSALEHGTFSASNLNGMGLSFALNGKDGRVVLLKDNGHAIQVTEQNVKEFLALAHEKREMIHLAFSPDDGETDPILMFPKEKAADLKQAEQLAPHHLNDTKLFDLVDGLESFTGDELNGIGITLTYCIPFSTFKYDLVPDGHTIPVTSKYKEDFISRVRYERDRLRGMIPAMENNSRQRENSASHPSQIHGGRSRSITSIPLTDNQIEMLKTFREKVSLLSSVDFNESQWADMGLAWCIRCGEITFDIIPDGTKVLVQYLQRNDFMERCLTKVDEILADQEIRKNVQVPVAAPQELQLFSPSHWEKDLFAPPQHITTRANITGGAQSQPTQNSASPFAMFQPADAVPFQAAPHPSHSSESLDEFLARNNCASAGPMLKANEVLHVSDLLELSEEDVSSIVTALLPRKRLLEALRQMKR